MSSEKMSEVCWVLVNITLVRELWNHVYITLLAARDSRIRMASAKV
jgi:hypothetical protein